MTIFPAFLVAETKIESNGHGVPFQTGEGAGYVLVTLGISLVHEQQSLLLSIQRSVDGETWEAEPLAVFPQRFYPGVCSLLLDFGRHPEAGWIRAAWKVDRWGRGDKTPLFRMYVFAEPVTNAELAVSSG